MADYADSNPRKEQPRDLHAGFERTLLDSLATTTSGFRFLLTTLHGGLHVVTASLELTKDSFGSHFTLEVLYGALKALVADLNLDRLTLNGIANYCHFAH